MEEIRLTVSRGERALVLTLTKKMAEDLTSFFQEEKLRVKYLHSDVEILKRMEILRDLRNGAFDVLVGINLLREGLDLPEVSLIAILDADREGFLRSATSLIQIIGRAARNVNGRVVMYADEVTPSMLSAVSETNRRRTIQEAYNQKHGITPVSVHKEVRDVLETLEAVADEAGVDLKVKVAEDAAEYRFDAMSRTELEKLLPRIEREMREASKQLAFEEAARLRDLAIAIRGKLSE